MRVRQLCAESVISSAAHLLIGRQKKKKKKPELTKRRSADKDPQFNPVSHLARSGECVEHLAVCLKREPSTAATNTQFKSLPVI